MWNDHNSSSKAAAANLRWRARVSKEAVNAMYDDHDDASTATYEVVGRAVRGPITRLDDPRLKALLLSTALMALMFCSIYSLRVTHSVWMSLTVTMSCTLACIIMWQQRTLQSLRLQQRREQQHSENQASSFQLRQLQQQQDRLYQRAVRLEQARRRRDQVQSELRHFVGHDEKRINECIDLAQELKQSKTRLLEKLRHDICETIVKTVVTAESATASPEPPRTEDRFCLTPQEVERLILALQSLSPAGVIHVHETGLRRVLDGESSLEAMERLLLQVLDKDKMDDERVFRLDVQQLLQRVQEQQQQQPSLSDTTDGTETEPQQGLL